MPPAPQDGARRPGAKAGGGKKILGLPRNQAIGLGVVAVAGLGFLLWRARKNAQKAAAQQQQAATCPDGSTPDQNGNCPQTSQDFSGQLSTLQDEIAQLQSELGAAGGGGSGGGGTGAGSVGGSTGTTSTTAGGTVAVPNLVGMRLADATGALSAVGLRIAGANQLQGVSQTVATQNPAAGTQVQQGSTVTVTTTAGGGSGGNTVTVPNVVGQRLATATGTLSAVGLRITGASQVKGVSQTVTGQNPAAGAKVAQGSAVRVTVRTG